MWMLAAILICGTAGILTSCQDLFGSEDNNTESTTEDNAVPTSTLEIDPSEFQPIDVNVALLGSFGNSADVEAARYWFKNVTNAVTKQTQVVITDEITDANKKAIRKVLKRYGTLLLIYPDEENVKQYADALGVDPDADYSMLELIGLSGFGDQFLSYASEDDYNTPTEVAPSSISEENLYELAPTEYLRLKAFAQWVDRIDKKYAEYQASKKAATRSDRAGTRGEGGNILDKIYLTTLPKIDRSIQVTNCELRKSYDNSGRAVDDAKCPVSVTCNYQFMPMYQFPNGKEPGADYYIVETTVSWDLTETVEGTSIQSKNHSTRNRRSYYWFPHVCDFYSEPVPTNSKYQVMVPKGGDLEPEGEVLDKDVTMSRSWNVKGNVSAGINPDDGPNADANLGFSADYSKEESYNVKQFSVNPKQSGSQVGHVISIPDDYRPVIGGDGDPAIIVPQGANFKRSLIVKESWIWKVSGTETDTKNSSIRVKFAANPEVAWYSYFYTWDNSWDKQAYKISMSKSISLPAPNRKNYGFLKITADTEEYSIFTAKVFDVTDGKTKKVVYKKDNLNISSGEVLQLALAAASNPAKKYTIELGMGAKANEAVTYVCEDYEVDGKSTVQELKTSERFTLKTSKDSWDYDDYTLIEDEDDDDDDE